ncbi:hypothetical protein [Tomitella gaofuii]|uniref:hypothetical protein n=1 Tax=Tomitella gaofuii TaxID=2760083 RepID=UPI0020C17A6B|nr:hypothetical protein [Tomitella gaofuii]
MSDRDNVPAASVRIPLHVPDPLQVLAEIEARRRHPAAAAQRTPMDTAQEFHDEVDAQTGRILPRRIPGAVEPTACSFGFEPVTGWDRWSELPRAHKAALIGVSTLACLLVAVALVGSWGW